MHARTAQHMRCEQAGCVMCRRAVSGEHCQVAHSRACVRPVLARIDELGRYRLCRGARGQHSGKVGMGKWERVEREHRLRGGDRQQHWPLHSLRLQQRPPLLLECDYGRLRWRSPASTPPSHRRRAIARTHPRHAISRDHARTVCAKGAHALLRALTAVSTLGYQRTPAVVTHALWLRTGCGACARCGALSTLGCGA